MPALGNKKAEKFAQSIAAGADAETGMRRAGFAPDRRNGPRLRKRPDIAARIQELVAIAETKRAATIAAAPGVTLPAGFDALDDRSKAAWELAERARLRGDDKARLSALRLVPTPEVSNRLLRKAAKAAEAAEERDADPQRSAKVDEMLQRVVPGLSGLAAVDAFLDLALPPADQPHEVRRRHLIGVLHLQPDTSLVEAERTRLVSLLGLSSDIGIWLALTAALGRVTALRVSGGPWQHVRKAYVQGEAAALVAGGHILEPDYADWIAKADYREAHNPAEA